MLDITYDVDPRADLSQFNIERINDRVHIGVRSPDRRYGWKTFSQSECTSLIVVVINTVLIRFWRSMNCQIGSERTTREIEPLCLA